MTPLNWPGSSINNSPDFSEQDQPITHPLYVRIRIRVRLEVRIRVRVKAMSLFRA